MAIAKQIYIGSDHAGYELKQEILEYLKAQSYSAIDSGCENKDSCDYPVFAHKLANSVKANGGLGILICGSGIGMSIAANRHPGIRAALCSNLEMAKLSRQHNDANILVLAARFLDNKEALAIVDAWLNTEFEGGRHQRRVDQIDA